MNLRRLQKTIAVAAAAACSSMWVLLAVPGLAQSSLDNDGGTQQENFDKHIAPLLAKRCLTCHSGRGAKGELDLSTQQSATRGGSSGEAAIADSAAHSLIWQQVESDSMPPEHPLSSDEKQLLRQWLDQGAVWGTSPIDPFQYSSDARAGRDWWSLQPLSVVTIQSGNGHPIDQLLQEARDTHGLSANPAADKRTLIRRITFDLIGLPPTREEIDRFLADESDDAYESLVDRLLDSPHYGERWARHWLDIVRFGESNGFEYDEPRDHAWPYRNWVIAAFNSDLPYDEFARMQIAGDALQPSDRDAAAAVGYLVAGPHNTTLPANAPMRMAMVQDEMEDLLGSVGQTFLGLTVHCARCHDHKFDPVSQNDYYQLAAALGGVTHGERTVRKALTSEQQQRLNDIDRQVKETRGAIDQMIEAARQRLLAKRTANVSANTTTFAPVRATATWEFDGDLNDIQGHLPLTTSGGATLSDSALLLDGKTGFAYSPWLAEDVNDKTLEVWLQLSTLDQRGGGAFSIETKDGSIFDAIVFGEQEPRKWMAGSNNFIRYRSFEATSEETEATQQLVHIAMVFHADGKISAYRNGLPYGSTYQSSGLQRYAAGEARLLFGLRHSPIGGNRLLAGRIERAQFTSRALTSEEVEASAANYDLNHVPKSLIVKSLSEADQEQLKQWETLVERLQAERTQIDMSQDQRYYTCVSAKPPTTHVLIRGDVGSPAEEVLPNGLSAIASVESDWKLDENSNDYERRIQLANWITNRDNPLFARVIVNRLWQYHFGQGLVATSSDLGFNGGLPSHPKLLDWLAGELHRNDYKLKPLHRLIVTSAAYQQSSQPNAEAQRIDADNKYLWRKSPQRLEAETLRDAMLVVTNRLNSEVGGQGYRDMRHYFYKGSHFYELQDPPASEPQRRTIYRFTPRGNQNPFLSTFDCPDPSAAAPRRPVTTTPLQSLALLNNSFTFDMADEFAKRLKQEAGVEFDQQVSLAYELAFGRKVTDLELSRCRDFVQQEDLAALCRVLFNSNEFLYVR